MWKVLLVFVLLTTAVMVVRTRRAQSFLPRAAAAPKNETPVKPSFDTDIKPIFQARCQPCHFPGGKVYDQMPFDKAETITRLGAKLFTRIKDQKEQKLIQAFLDNR